jgi:hypothetical protein
VTLWGARSAVVVHHWVAPQGSVATLVGAATFFRSAAPNCSEKSNSLVSLGYEQCRLTHSSAYGITRRFYPVRRKRGNRINDLREAENVIGARPVGLAIGDSQPMTPYSGAPVFAHQQTIRSQAPRRVLPSSSGWARQHVRVAPSALGVVGL